jgi:hypothetical protein
MKRQKSRQEKTRLEFEPQRASAYSHLPISAQELAAPRAAGCLAAGDQTDLKSGLALARGDGLQKSHPPAR